MENTMRTLMGYPVIAETTLPGEDRNYQSPNTSNYRTRKETYGTARDKTADDIRDMRFQSKQAIEFGTAQTGDPKLNKDLARRSVDEIDAPLKGRQTDALISATDIHPGSPGYKESTGIGGAAEHGAGWHTPEGSSWEDTYSKSVSSMSKDSLANATQSMIQAAHLKVAGDTLKNRVYNAWDRSVHEAVDELLSPAAAELAADIKDIKAAPIKDDK
jgi:hypothetical protein